MEFSHDLTYGATPSEVSEMLADRDFRVQVCDAMHCVRHDISVDGAGAGMKVVVDQTQDARGLPGFAKKVVGDSIQIVQRETWTDETSAVLTLEIPGKPGRLDGTIALVDDGRGGTVETVTGDLRVKLPLIGGRLETVVSDMLVSALRAEQRVGRAWLAGRKS
jgi:hypothetical protein